MAPASVAAIVAECGRRLLAHVEELARLTALETGKALRTESRGERPSSPTSSPTTAASRAS
ncbi:MAG: hypothetical protein R3F60_11235 [bacterium]